MFDIQFNADAVKTLIGQIADRFRKSAQEAIEETGEAIVSEMRIPGEPITYPVQWDSEKQRKFVMAKLRRENNLPYKRTGSYINGWTTTPLPNGIAISNQSPAGAIGGTLTSQSSPQAIGGASLTSWQSKIHRGRWKSILVVTLQAIADLPRRVIEKIRVTAR